MKTWILDLLFPPKCVFCRKLLQSHEKGCCLACLGDLPETDLRKPIRHTKGCRAPFLYKGTVREALLRFKFGDKPSYAETFGPMLAVKLQDCNADFITWVPVSGLRRFERGYDQAELLAQAVANARNLPCIPVLHKKHRRRQSTLNGYTARNRNIKGAFTVRDAETVWGKTIILIDDICTTGATMEEAARMLHQAGASAIHCAVFALTDKR